MTGLLGLCLNLECVDYQLYATAEFSSHVMGSMALPAERMNERKVLPRTGLVSISLAMVATKASLQLNTEWPVSIPRSE